MFTIVLRKQPNNPYDKYAIGGYVQVQEEPLGPLTLVGHLPRELCHELTQISAEELSCVDCQVADANPVAAPGQKGLQILINMKIVLHKRKCAMVRRRLRRRNLI